MKGDAGGGGLKGVRIDMMNDGNDSPGIVSGFQGKTLGTQIKGYARLAGTGGKLGVQHLVDLPQARVGSVPALLASCKRQHGENAKKKKASEERGWTVYKTGKFSHEIGGSVHDLKAAFFDDRVGEHFF